MKGKLGRKEFALVLRMTIDFSARSLLQFPYFCQFYCVIPFRSDGFSYICSHIIRLIYSSDVVDNILIMKLMSFFIFCRLR